jgi:hypothetical protein
MRRDPSSHSKSGSIHHELTDYITCKSFGKLIRQRLKQGPKDHATASWWLHPADRPGLFRLVFAVFGSYARTILNDIDAAALSQPSRAMRHSR